MRYAILALGLCSAAIVPAASAQSSGDAMAMPDGSASMVVADNGCDGGKMPRFGRGQAKDQGHDGKGGARGRKIDGTNTAGFALAAQLSALETRIGIKVEQLDAWRDYTTALQDLLASADPEKPDEEHRDPQTDVHRQKDPFDRDQKLADRLILRAANAERLKAAIASLRGALTPLQLEQLALANSTDRLQGPGFSKAAAGPDDRPDHRWTFPPKANGDEDGKP